MKNYKRLIHVLLASGLLAVVGLLSSCSLFDVDVTFTNSSSHVIEVTPSNANDNSSFTLAVGSSHSVTYPSGSDAEFVYKATDGGTVTYTTDTNSVTFIDN